VLPHLNLKKDSCPEHFTNSFTLKAFSRFKRKKTRYRELEKIGQGTRHEGLASFSDQGPKLGMESLVTEHKY